MYKPPIINWIFELEGEKKQDVYQNLQNLPPYHGIIMGTYKRIIGAWWVLFRDAVPIRIEKEEIGKKCECCGSKHVAGFSIDDIPLCETCGRGLESAPSNPT